MDGIRALVFDVFGTLVDWRGSIAREAHVLLAPLGIAIELLAAATQTGGESAKPPTG